MKVDFHLHTWCSDGALPPAEMLAAIRREGVESFAITDHDTCSGWRVLRGAHGLLPGVEVTSGHDHREVHIVGLGIDPDHPQLADLLARIRVIRVERMGALLARLPETLRRGLTVDDVRDRRPGAGESLSRNHLARALVQRGGISSVREAFDSWLGDEHLRDPGLPEFPPTSEVCAALHAAGGIALLAHPGIYRSMAVIEGLVAQGCDGLEAAHPHLDPTLGAGLRARGLELGWLFGVGSDTHVVGTRRPGQAVLEPALLAPLLDRLGILKAAA